MEFFHFAVLAIASIIFIIALTMIGLVMQKGSKSGTFPPMASNCPDGWIESSSTEGVYTCMAPSETTVPVNAGVAEIAIGLWTSADSKTITYTDKVTSICSKQKWANKNAIVWDGVTNYNSC